MIPRTGWELKSTVSTNYSKLLSFSTVYTEKTIQNISLKLLFTLNWQRKIKQQLKEVTLCISAVLGAGCDQMNEVQVFFHPHEVHSVLRSLPNHHHGAKDGPVNPQCHCSQTTVEIEVSKCMAWRYYKTHFPQAQQSSWRRCSRFMKRLAGIVN